MKRVAKAIGSGIKSGLCSKSGRGRGRGTLLESLHLKYGMMEDLNLDR